MELVQRMLITAKQRMRDATFAENSNATRFDCAYTAIRAIADMALHLEGFRTSTSKPGHHQTAIQCLSHSLGVDDATVRILDGLRKQRNGSDYEGDPVTDAALNECLNQARNILERIEHTLKNRT